MNSPGHTPPSWVRNLLEHFLEPRLLEASLGDLEEKFRHRIQTQTSLRKARWLYVMEALGFLRLARKPRNIAAQTNINMISHTFLFFTRLVRKDKSYYLVSLLGLTISLSSFLFIMMFINDELAYDKFHQKRERIFRVSAHIKQSDLEFNMATTQFPAAQALQTELPEVEEAVRLFRQNPVLEYGKESLRKMY
jgi:putative ABC transport system permease protein